MLEVKLYKNNKLVQVLKNEKFSDLYYVIRKNFNLIKIDKINLFEYKAEIL